MGVDVPAIAKGHNMSKNEFSVYCNNEVVLH